MSAQQVDAIPQRYFLIERAPKGSDEIITERMCTPRFWGNMVAYDGADRGFIIGKDAFFTEDGAHRRMCLNIKNRISRTTKELSRLKDLLVEIKRNRRKDKPHDQ